MTTLQSLAGLVVFIGLAWLLSENRKNVAIKTVVAGLLLQFFLALLFLKTAVFKQFFVFLNKVVLVLSSATQDGTRFVFGYLGGGDLPFVETMPGSSFILAFQALPLILIISALSSLLFYLKVLPFLVKALSKVLQKVMAIGGSVSIGCAANIFVGMVEAPLLIKEYLGKMERHELFILMTTGMATVAGTVMVLYAQILEPVLPGAMGHLLTASLISAPAAVMISLVLVPAQKPSTCDEVELKSPYLSCMDAITRGTMDGVRLLINIIGMLVVLVALVSLINQLLGMLPQVGGTQLSLQGILGYILAPVAWLLGIPWDQAVQSGQLLGTKVILNEFLAYLQLVGEGKQLSRESITILSYALCGFANFGSLGIMLGGLITMAPERRNQIVELGAKSILSGNLASFMTGAVVGVIT